MTGSAGCGGATSILMTRASVRGIIRAGRGSLSLRRPTPTIAIMDLSDEELL